MIIKGVILAVGALNSFSEMFSSWEQLGFFTYLLPFLLIFALVFGVLSKVNIFGANKAVNVIIALVVGLMALQFPLVPQFFSAILPRVGIALIIILSIFIIIGLFAPRNTNWINYVLLGVAALIVIIVLVQTASSLGIGVGEFAKGSWGTIVLMLIIVAGVIVIISSGGKRQTGQTPAIIPIWTQND